jgi:Mrp family chromosome partitioning ATPase
MKTSAEVIDIEEVRCAKPSNSDGGSDHFTTMKIGTVFCVASNGQSSSFLTDYVLLSKSGVTVLLGEMDERGNNLFRRVIGNKFWKQNTLVQILHVPEEIEEEKGDEDG